MGLVAVGLCSHFIYEEAEAQRRGVIYIVRQWCRPNSTQVLEFQDQRLSPPLSFSLFSFIHFLFSTSYLNVIFKNIYLFIWLFLVLVVACGI